MQTIEKSSKKTQLIEASQKEFLAILGITVLLGILLVTTLLIILKQNKEIRESSPIDSSSLQSTVSTMPTSSVPGTSTSTITSAATGDLQWKTYTYDYEYISPAFSFSYPADWNFTYSDRAVEWDITLTNTQGEEIQIDYSSFNDPYSSETSYLKYLDFWVKYGQEDNYSFTGTIMGDGKVNGISYRIYKVTASDSQFLVAILDVTNQQGRKGELGIRTKNLSEEAVFWGIFNSLHQQ